MLRVRVMLQPLAGGDHQTIWDRPLHVKQEERMEMSFDDGSGSRCRVDASFQGAHIFPVDGGTQVDLTFAGDKYRVW